MKGKSLFLFSAIVLVAGVALALAYSRVSSTGVVMAGGIMFIIAGLVDMMLFVSERNGGQGGSRRSGAALAFGVISSFAAVALGLCMLVFRPTFVALIPFIFGALVACAALFQFYLLAVGVRPVELPAWLYVLPLLIAVGAVYVFTLTSGVDDSRIMLVTGGGMALCGLATMLEALLLGAHNRAERKRQAAAAATASDSAKVEDIEPVEPDEPRGLPVK